MQATSVTGGSSLDVNGIVSQLMTIEQRPLTLLQQKEAAIQSRITSLGSLQGSLSALQSAAAKLADSAAFNGLTAAVDGDGLTAAVTSSTTAVPGQYAVEVRNLAASQALASAAFASSSTTFATGHIVLQRGSFSGNAFTPAAGADPVTVTIDASNNSLAGIRDAINAANAGVSATLVDDGSGLRLSLLAKDTGAVNSFRITTTDDLGVDTTSDPPVGTALSQFAYDPSAAGGPVTNLTQTRAAQDAQVVVNGLTINSASNLISGVIDGATLNLKKSAVGVTNTVTLGRDTTAMRASVDALVKAYNDFINTAKALTTFNPTTKRAGMLNGDSTVRSFQSQISAVVRSAMTPASSGDFTNLSDIGIQIQKDGTLSVNDAKFTAATADGGRLSRLFGGNGGSESTQGFAVRFKTIADALVGTDGMLPGRTKSLQAQVDALNKRQDDLQSRLALTQKRLIAQYSALDAQLQAMQSVSDSLTSALAPLQASISNGK